MLVFGKTKIKKDQFSRFQLLLFVLVFAIVGAYILISSFATSNPNLPGDLNNDNTVNVTDLSIILSNYGTTNIAGDANSDGNVNILDLSIVLSHYGQSYTANSNLALNKPATASSIETVDFPAQYAFDGDSTTRWSSAHSDPQWLQVDLGSTQTIGRVVLQWETAYATAYQIQTSNDGTNWTTIYSTTTGDGGTDDLTVTGNGRYVRMYGTQRATFYGYSLWEMAVYGSSSGSGGGGGGSGPSITGRWYLDSSTVNTPIPANPPIHPDSTAMIQNNPSWVLPSSSPYKQWLGPRERYALSIQTNSIPTVPVKVDYDDSVGNKCSANIVNTPIPSSWSGLFGNFANDASYDAAFAIVTADGTEYDSWKTTAPGVQPWNTACPPDSYWHTARDDLDNALTGLGYCFTLGCHHQSGSGMWSGAGLIMPQDTQTGQPYNHALNLISDGHCLDSNQPHPFYVPPATSGDGDGSGISCFPTGARIQLDPSIDVANDPNVTALPASEQAWMVPLLKTMQTYGMIVEDSSGCQGCGGVGAGWASTVAPYAYPWQSAGQGWSYGNGVPYNLMSRFRVIDWTKWTGT